MTEAFAPETILYGKELDRWLGSFPGMDKDQCLEKIDAIWAEQGFLSPADLSTELLASQLVPDASNADYETLIYNLMESAHPHDQLTGFADKPESPLLTGLCHLYAQRTGVPVTLVDGDYGNMGGTNGYYRDLMKQSGLGGRRFDDGFDKRTGPPELRPELPKNHWKNWYHSTKARNCCRCDPVATKFA